MYHLDSVLQVLVGEKNLSDSALSWPKRAGCAEQIWTDLQRHPLYPAGHLNWSRFRKEMVDWKVHQPTMEDTNATNSEWKEGYFFCFVFFSAAGFVFFGSWFYALLLLWFSAFLLFLLFAFPASLLFMLLCFSALPFLFCFSAFPASLLLCFCASVPFYFYYSTFSFLQSCVFAALLPAPLLLCFLSLLPLCFFLFFCFILSCLYP